MEDLGPYSDPETLEFTVNLGKELSRRKISRATFSSDTEIPLGTIHSWFHPNPSIPSVHAAYKVARYLGVPIEYLVVGRVDKLFPAKNFGKSDRSLLAELIDQLYDVSAENLRALVLVAKGLKAHQVIQEDEEMQRSIDDAVRLLTDEAETKRIVAKIEASKLARKKSPGFSEGKI